MQCRRNGGALKTQWLGADETGMTTNESPLADRETVGVAPAPPAVRVRRAKFHLLWTMPVFALLVAVGFGFVGDLDNQRVTGQLRPVLSVTVGAVLGFCLAPVVGALALVGHFAQKNNSSVLVNVTLVVSFLVSICTVAFGGLVYVLSL